MSLFFMLFASQRVAYGTPAPIPFQNGQVPPDCCLSACSMLRVITISVIALLAYTESHATLVKWTLNKVAFDDGGTASGSFLVDTNRVLVDTGKISYVTSTGFAIATTSGLEGMAVMYPGSLAGSDMVMKSHLVSFSDFPPMQKPLFQLAIEADFGQTTRGTFNLLSECSLNDFLSRCSHEVQGAILGEQIRRDVRSGSISAAVVPEPHLLACLALPALFLIVMRNQLRGLHRSQGSAIRRCGRSWTRVADVICVLRV